VDFGELRVFQDAATFPLIMIISKEERRTKPLYASIKRLDFDSLDKEVGTLGYKLEDAALGGGGFTLVDRSATKLLEKIKAGGVPLGEYVGGKIYYGIKTGFNEAFVIDASTKDMLIKKDGRSAEIIKPFIVGDDVRRYHVNFCDSYLILNRIGVDIKRYPAVFEHLKQFQKQLEKRWDKGNYWYELRACNYYAEFEKPKIVWPEIAKESRFAWEEKLYFYNKTCFIMPSTDFYLLALLNSKLIWHFLLRICPVLGDPDKRGRLTQQWVYMKQVPIRSGIDKTFQIKRDILINLSSEMISLHGRQADAKADSDRLMLERQIKATDKKIDHLVYELYGLTDREIGTIEEP
jgi:hypothetical protein